MKKILYLSIIFLSFGICQLFADLNNFQKGKSFYEEKKYDQAKFKFEQDIVFNPRNEESYLYLSKIYKLKKNDDLEESNLKTVILLNPKNEEAILNLTLLKIRKSNYSETKELIKNFKSVCKNLCKKSSSLQKKLDDILNK